MGSGPEMGLPTALPAYDPPILPIARKRELAYTVQRGADSEFMDFGVDGFPFDPARAPYQMELGTAEEWTLYNSVDNKLLAMPTTSTSTSTPSRSPRSTASPSTSRSGVTPGSSPATPADSFTFEHNFDDFTGKFVEHCHVLAHEDLGMMEALEVIEPPAS